MTVENTGPALRLVTYNVHGLRDDRAALVEVVRELAPDVLVLQEAPRRFRWRTRCAGLASSLGMLYAAGGLPSLGNVIFTTLRVAVRSTGHLRYPLTPGRHMRGAVFAHCVVGRTPFMVAGSHLSLDPEERPEQARLLKKAMGEADAPVLFGGDLNETAGGSSWRIVAEGMVDAGVAARPDAEGGAGNERADRVGLDWAGATHPSHDPRYRLDAVLLDPRVAVTGYRVVDSPAARRASDHLPVAADLVLPG